MSQSPNFDQILEKRRAALMAGLRIFEPGQIVSYDAATSECSVQPLLQRTGTDDRGEVEIRTQPIINHCPVVWAEGGGFGETFPLAVGDTVAIAWFSRSVDLWLARGGLVDPEDDRVNHISDALVFPGLFSFNAPRLGVPTDRACFGKLGIGASRLEVTSSEVLVGGGGLPHEPTIKATTYASVRDPLLSSMASLLAQLATAVDAIVPNPVMLETAAALVQAKLAFDAALATIVTTVAKVR